VISIFFLAFEKRNLEKVGTERVHLGSLQSTKKNKGGGGTEYLLKGASKLFVGNLEEKKGCQ